MRTAVASSTDKSVDPELRDEVHRAKLVEGQHDFGSLTDAVCSISESAKPPTLWSIAICFSSALMLLFFGMLGHLVTTGVGVWGNNMPVAWAFDIINFVFWVGIGHAGTLISAVLFLFRQKWRTSINRFAEAMTIFAVVCAAIFPGLHVGRPWLAYWLFPLPNQMLMWPQFRSPLLWDVFAVGTYATTSLLFWYYGMIPDLATLRDRSKTKWRRFFYGIFAMGWRGSNRHWHRYEKGYLLLAALATPLVLSVHSVVSFDFATAQLPGWHATIFPPYFVAGAIFGGFAMVVLLMVPARAFFGLKDFVTMRHLENMNKIILLTGTVVGYAYAMEFFIAWYGGNHYEQFAFINRAFGPYAWAYWLMICCNVLSPQLFWIKAFRRSTFVMTIVAILVTIGMWFERFVIIVISLHRDFLPSSWGFFVPTPVDLLTFAGSFGLFFTLFLLFCRYLPMLAMAEIKGVMPQAHAHAIGEEHGHSSHHEVKP